MAQTILEIQLKGVKEAEASVESLSQELVKQKSIQSDLRQEIKLLEKTMKEEKGANDATIKSLAQKNIELEQSRKITRENTTALRQNIKVIDAQEGSLDQMRASLNLLQKEYAALDQTTQEGAMQANLLKSRIQVLDEAVKGQEESIGDHRRSVGDYGKALEGLGRYFPLLGANISAVTPFMGEFGTKLQKFTPLIGALGQNLSEGGRILNGFAESGGKATKAIGQTSEAVEAMPKGLKGLKAGFLAAKTGIVSATRAALTFMATPIGLVLTAIVAAVGAAVAAFAVANKRAEKEAEAARKKLAEERQKIEAEYRAMNRALADALIIGEAEIKVMKKGFGDAFEDLNTLFDQAGKDGGKAYGDNFTSTVETSVEESKALTTQQFELQKAAIEKQLALTEANLEEFTLNAGIVQAFGEEAAQNVARQTSPAYAQAEQSVKDYTKQLALLEQQYKADIAEADALGQATIELSENFEESEESLAEQERRREQRSAERARRREEARRAEEQRLQTLKDIVNAEIERNLTESELLEKRLNEKLKELGLDKDITKLTEQELAARTALLDKFNADIQDIEDKAAEEKRKKEEEEEKAEEERHQRTLDRIQEEFEARINATEQSANIEVLALETAHLDKMRLLDLTDEQRVEAERQLQLDILQVQKDSAQEQLDLLQKTVQLASVGIGQMPEGYQQTMAELSNAIAQISLEIDNISTVLPEDESLIDMLGLSEERVEKANLAMDTLSQGLNIMTQSMQVQQQNRMNAIDEQVKQGVITEEEAARKKERIQKDFARKQQKVDITQALINTALAVTSALATKPFLPMGLIAAGIATATGAAQVASIKAQKFSKGGLLSGPSHAQGGIPMFSKGGAFYGEAEGGEAVLTKGVMANPALASMASAINVAGGGVPFFANGGVLEPIQSATPTDRAADIIASGMKSRQPVLVVEQLRERENSVDVIESLRTIG